MSYSGKLRLHPLAIAVCLSVTQIGYADEVQVNTKEAIELGRILVKAQSEGENGDAQGYDDVYSRDMSSVYRGKEELERYRGGAPADILKGMTGVYSGDARNSGAIDINIRGVQGQGRVPVTIDGTEQAITVNRGYFGASNRNYLDPNLISSITVEKGATMSKDVKTSVGGGVAMTTIGIDDIVLKDQKFGVDFKIDTGTNTTGPRLPDLSPEGMDYRDSPETVYPSFTSHPNLLKDPKSRGKASDQFNLKDGSARVAIGYRGEIFDLMGALSYREQGNYFSGKRNASVYLKDGGAETATGGNAYMPDVAETYPPGSEVLNTSSKNRSLLLKNTWYISDEQRLLLTARHSIIEHGELMPSRIIRYYDGGLQQWPIGKINQRAYSAQYKLQPGDNRWVNFDLNVWKTITNSNTYTGGSLLHLDDRDWEWNRCHEANNGDVSSCVRNGNEYPYKNDALAHTRDTRWGFTAHNTMEVMDNLKFTAGIDYQREKLRSETKTREGKRRGTSLMFNFEWQPIPTVTINAGVKRNSYSSFDDRLAEGRSNQDINYARRALKAVELNMKRTISQEEYDFYQKTDALVKSFKTAEEKSEWNRANKEDRLRYLNLGQAIKYNGGTIDEKHIFSQREDGRYYRDDNPYLNGTLSQKEIVNPVTGEKVPEYKYISTQNHFTLYDKDMYAPVKRKSGHSWSPIVSIGWEMTDYSRIYARYAEDKRYPSMFEDTVGFSTAVQDRVILRPEKSRNMEVGYIYDLSWLPNTEAGDIKISYYDTKLNNVIERDGDMVLSQVDKQHTKGIEVQARYSNGKYYASLGVNYNLKNKTCDESSSMRFSANGNFPECVDGGFPLGSLRTSLVPKYSVNLSLGGKFFDNRLEAGTDMNYHSRARNDQEQMMMKEGLLVTGGLNNNPIRWDSVFVVDAYMKYKIDRNFSMTFSAQNLTNQYYIDPLTRSFMPAPGRTFRIGFEGNL